MSQKIVNYQNGSVSYQLMDGEGKEECAGMIRDSVI
jgi:hypothetical protein